MIVFVGFEARKFQFTHPGRGATCDVLVGVVSLLQVSIHAPREGCDSSTLFCFTWT